MSTSEQKQFLQDEFQKQGYAVLDQFFSVAQCNHFLEMITQFRQGHILPEIHRKVRGRSLRYKVIDGEKIEQHLPEIAQLYRQINELVREINMNQDLVPLDNKKVGVNVNITERGGTYQWHYDRNAVTVLLYLNEVTGGELEFYPNYRIFLKNKGPNFLQQCLDNLLRVGVVRDLFGKKVTVKPAPGRLVVMKGNRSLHSVRAVEDDKERLNIVLAYNIPHATFHAEKQLDAYLYVPEPMESDRS